MTLRILALSTLSFFLQSWGFFAHRLIHEHAIYLLPDPLFGFYKEHMDQLVIWATLADQRRYIVAEEGSRHFMDLEFYEKGLPLDTISISWDSAKTRLW